jgi:hypothetical protein
MMSGHFAEDDWSRPKELGSSMQHSASHPSTSIFTSCGVGECSRSQSRVMVTVSCGGPGPCNAAKRRKTILMKSIN